jgi:hypothetical protein
LGTILGLRLDAVYARLIAYRWFLRMITLLDSVGAFSGLFEVVYYSGSSIIAMRHTGKLGGFESYC